MEAWRIYLGDTNNRTSYFYVIKVRERIEG